MYNLEVEDWHTYFVSAVGVWAHNRCTYVYIGFDRTTDEMVYTGISYNWVARQVQHDRTRDIDIYPFAILNDRYEALLLEQGVITKYDLINTQNPNNNQRNNFASGTDSRNESDDYWERNSRKWGMPNG
jgi:hypothetical protein